MKKKFNMESGHTNYELLARIADNPANIKVVWGNCLDNLKMEEHILITKKCEF